MNMDVRDLEFSVRCSNCMARMNIKKLSELTAMSKDEISKMRNIGKKSIDEMDGKLDPFYSLEFRLAVGAFHDSCRNTSFPILALFNRCPLCRRTVKLHRRK